MTDSFIASTTVLPLLLRLIHQLIHQERIDFPRRQFQLRRLQRCNAYTDHRQRMGKTTRCHSNDRTVDVRSRHGFLAAFSRGTGYLAARDQWPGGICAGSLD